MRFSPYINLSWTYLYDILSMPLAHIWVQHLIEGQLRNKKQLVFRVSFRGTNLFSSLLQLPKRKQREVSPCA